MTLPQELISLYETPEYNGSGVTDLQNIVFEEGNLTLYLLLYTYEDEKDKKPLQVVLKFHNVVEFDITERSWDFFEEINEHAKFLHYQQPRSELYIKCAPKQLEVAFVKCIQAVDALVPERKNGLTVIGLSSSSLLFCLTRGFGRLAVGPKEFIEALATILKAHSAKPSILPTSPKSKSWVIDDTYGSTPYEKERMRLMTFGNNWILYEQEEGD